MSLPARKNELYYKAKLPSGKEVEYRPWRVKEEKELLFAIEGISDRDQVTPHIISLLQSCLKEGSIELYSPVDILAFGVEVFKRSKGEEIEIFYTCPHCGIKHDDPIIVNLNTSTKKKEFNSAPLEVGDYVFEFEELCYRDQLILAKKYESSIRKFRFFHMVKCLKSVTYEGEVYNHFTEKEAEDFFDSMPVEDFEKLIEMFTENYSDIVIMEQVKCPKCSNAVRVYVNDLFDFFV